MEASEVINDSSKLVAQAYEHIRDYLKESEKMDIRLVEAKMLLEEVQDKLTNKM